MDLIEIIDFELRFLELLGYFVLEGTDVTGFKIHDLLFFFLELILQDILKHKVNIIERDWYQFVILLHNFLP